jgi:hypothetical protein
MEVRDAVEADAERLADLTDSPRDVMVNLVHDRTVRVAFEEAGDPSVDDGDASSNGRPEDSDGAITGFVSYDARADTVHVTQLEGDPDSCDRLLDEPVRFAAAEGMQVEILVPEDESTTRRAAEVAGFERVGSGPTFAGTPTVRYRHDPA